MNRTLIRATPVVCALAIATLAYTSVARSDPPPISAFARGEAIVAAALSGDGRYLAVIATQKDGRVVVVRDRKAPASQPPVGVLASTADRYEINWCRWATDTRLLCGLIAPQRIFGAEMNYAATRLMAVDADGKNGRVLLENDSQVAANAQLQDSIIDWNPGPPNTVLIALQSNIGGLSERTATTAGNGSGVVGSTTAQFPSVFELNVVTGLTHERLHWHAPLREFLTDHHGTTRLGWGIIGNTTDIEFQTRDSDAGSWRHLMTVAAFSKLPFLQPISICSDSPRCAYALGTSEGRLALWRMDLDGKSAPVVEFSHPLVDVGVALFATDGRLLGVEYDTDRPYIYYTDPQLAALLQKLNQALPAQFIVLVSASRDQKVFLVRASSDVDAGTYYVLDLEQKSLIKIGSAYPELDPKTLGRMQSINYPAQDGTSIPGYLTAPPGVRPEHLPLIVMPHGGPIYRDSWSFDFLREFLVSRGYVVLQMNFRGSSGYGQKWLFDAHQDWGGLTYSDIIDGARWAVKQGIADPARMCIVGWSFGGYAALLGAVRNPDLFRCSVSIAGVSDLSLLEAQYNQFIELGVAREQVGVDRAKLKTDSPRLHAADLRIPLLMLHGDRDVQVDVDQSEAMDRALTIAGKAHRFVLVSGAGHQFARESERTTLLTEVEKFLASSLGPAGK